MTGSWERRDLLTYLHYKELRSLLQGFTQWFIQGLCKDIIGSHHLIVYFMLRNYTYLTFLGSVRGYTFLRIMMTFNFSVIGLVGREKTLTAFS